MKQHFPKQLARLWLFLAILFLSACGGKDGKPDEASIQKAIAAANDLVYENQTALAIQRLEELEKQSPGNPQVIEALAFAYAKQPDPMMAALYFDQAFQLNPSNGDLALYAAQSHQQSGNPKGAADAYRKYLDIRPEDAAAWKALGQAEFEQKHSQAALNAYLEAFRQSRQTPTHEEAALIGHLYHSVNNRAQATKWYMQALRPGGASADRLNAQLGLFEIALREKEWSRAVELMDQIEREFPGELDSGPYKSARQELTKWRTAQNALQGTIGETSAPEPTPEPAPEPAPVEEAAPAAMTEEELLAASAAAPAVAVTDVTVSETVETPVAVDPNLTATPTESVSVATEDAVITPTASGDLIVAQTTEETATTDLGNVNDDVDLVMAKGLPTPPVTEEIDLTEEMQAAATETAADSEGALEVADVEVAEVEAEEPEVKVTEVRITRTEDGGVEVTGITEDDAEAVPQGRIEIDPPSPTMTAADRAKLAYEAEDYVTAIRFYREAIASDYRNPELAYDLSRAYYNNGQYREAEIYASEATRLSPSDVRYTLNYLRAIQRTMSRDALMRELVKAKEKFPNSPDITLALGRAYEVIMGNTRNARFLYEEFVQMAPTHPRAADIQAKLQTLPQ